MEAGSFVPLVIAPVVGSFAGVLVRRLPAGRGVVRGRSACEACGTPLAPLDLVPVVSFLALRGRCRHCGAPIHLSHLHVELAAVAVAASAVAAGAPPMPLVACGLGWALLAAGWIDWLHFRLPDVLTLPLLLAGLGVTACWAPLLLTDHALAAAAGYGAFRLVALGYRAVRGREGLGHGDAKLLAAGGAWLGLAALPAVVLGAALLGLGAAGVLALRGGGLRADTRLPFGPAIAAAIWTLFLLASDLG